MRRSALRPVLGLSVWMAFAVCGALGTRPEQAAAAAPQSVDCLHPGSPLMQQVCASRPKQPDKRMAAALAHLRQSLPHQLFAQVQSSQKGWLITMSAFCSRSEPGSLDDVACVDDEHRQRLAELGQIIRKIGDLTVFQRITYRLQGSGKLHDTVPVVIHPQSPSILPLNEYVESLAKNGAEIDECGDQCKPGYDALQYIKINERFGNYVSISVSYWENAGGAHGHGGVQFYTYNMRINRPIAVPDLFNSALPWKKAIIDDCLSQLGRRNLSTDPDDQRSRVESFVSDPNNLALTKNGISVPFGLYTVATYAEGMQDVVVPYSVVAPYLRQNDPLVRDIGPSLRTVPPSSP